MHLPSTQNGTELFRLEISLSTSAVCAALYHSDCPSLSTS